MRKSVIPEKLKAEFFAALDAADNDDLPDGAWFAVLEETAERFMRQHRIKGCENTAVHQWIQAKGVGNG